MKIQILIFLTLLVLTSACAPAATDEIADPTFTLSPTITNTISPTFTIPPTTTPIPHTPTVTQTQVNVLDYYITATPFLGSDDHPGTALFDVPECPIQFRYPSDWEITYYPEYTASGVCVLSFHPGHWLAFIEEHYLQLAEDAGQMVYRTGLYPGGEIGFWFQDGYWYLSDDPMMPGPSIPLIKAGNNYILRGEIAVRRYVRETDAYAGLQSYLVFSISNAEGESISISSDPYEVKDGLEMILRSIQFLE